MTVLDGARLTGLADAIEAVCSPCRLGHALIRYTSGASLWWYTHDVLMGATYGFKLLGTPSIADCSPIRLRIEGCAGFAMAGESVPNLIYLACEPVSVIRDACARLSVGAALRAALEAAEAARDAALEAAEAERASDSGGDRG